MSLPEYTQTLNVNFKVPRPLLAPPPFPFPPPEEFTDKPDVETWIIVSLIVLVFLALVEATVDKCIARVQIITEEDDPDLETAQVHAAAIIVSDLNNLNDFSDHPWVIEIMESLRESMEERRRERLQALEELLPIVAYDRVERTSSCSDCAICLESFQDGESCRVFPDCNHIFHSACISYWLEDHQTCPLCRGSVADV